MKKSSHKYYLSVSGISINLDKIEAFKDFDMENFLILSLFTSLFKGPSELLQTLRELNLYDGPTDEPIKIVKRIGNKKTGYSESHITDDILYKNASKFLSIGGIKRMLYQNREQTEFIKELLRLYQNSIEELIAKIETKIENLTKELKVAPAIYATDIKGEIESRKNSLNNFERQATNIAALLAIISSTHSSYLLADTHYIERLDEFVDNETHYYKGKAATPNNRGLVRLALNISKIAEKYPEIESTSSMSVDDLKLKIAKSLKRALNEINCKPEKTKATLERYEEEHDPDEFAFLTEDDFHLSENPTQEELDSHTDSIENLRERQDQLGDDCPARRFH